ncbi:MAG: DNA internalization-related competence protein ComEC/Rec2 [Bacillota bacterium]
MKQSTYEFNNLSRALAIAVVFFIFGIVIGYFTEFTYYMPLAIASFLLITFLLAPKPAQRSLLLFSILMLGIFWIDFHEADTYLLEEWSGEKVKIEGEIAGFSISKDVQEVTVSKINGKALSSQSKIAVFLGRDDTQKYYWGKKVSFTGVLEKTLSAVNPGGFSERDFWRQKAIGYKLKVHGSGKIEERGHLIGYYITKLRGEIHNLININLPQQEAGIILGLLLGDKGSIDQEFYESAQKMGIAHIFAVSGLHVGMVLTFYLVLTKYLKLPDTIIFTGAICLLIAYSLVTGLTPSVLRASIMALLGMAAIKLLRFKDFYTVLAFAAFIILLYNPLAVFNVGFQLSFAAAWGLVYIIPLAKKVAFFLPDKHRILLAVPLAAQLATLPLTVYYFNTLSFLAPFYNLLAVPIVSLLIPILFGALFLSIISVYLAQPLILLGGGLVYVLIIIIDNLRESVGAGYFNIATPSLVMICGYYILLIGIKEYGRIKKFFGKYGFLFSIILIIFFLYLALPNTVSFEAAILDVGQGDGAVIQTPANQFIVIDGGPGTNAITGYLRHKGVNKIALAVLSHPDSDHINGLLPVITQFKVNTLLVPPEIGNSELFNELKKIAVKKKVKIIEGKPDMLIKIPGNVLLRVLSPDLDKKLNWDTNNASLVVNLTYNNQDFLFTGDIDGNILYKLLPSINDIEVIKIPHHGSKGSFSESFYDNLRPDFAVVSAGRGNRYGHPHPEVIQGLQEAGIKIFRTDQNGAVIIKAVGNRLEFKTMLVSN